VWGVSEDQAGLELLGAVGCVRFFCVEVLVFRGFCALKAAVSLKAVKFYY